LAFDITQEKTDFKDIELDEFGESVVYTNGKTGKKKTILAIRPTTRIAQLKTVSTQFNPIKTRMDLLVSRIDIAEVNKGEDTVKLRVEPDDDNEKTLKVAHCSDEYGAWRLGLV